MPVRSLNSSVLTWPDAKQVERAVRHWAQEIVRQRPDVIRIGYFGSYARGDWGVGSDLDLVIISKHAHEPFEPRAVNWDVTRLPVPTDVLVYTQQEWESRVVDSRFGKTVTAEAVWVYESIK